MSTPFSQVFEQQGLPLRILSHLNLLELRNFSCTTQANRQSILNEEVLRQLFDQLALGHTQLTQSELEDFFQKHCFTRVEIAANALLSRLKMIDFSVKQNPRELTLFLNTQQPKGCRRFTLNINSNPSDSNTYLRELYCLNDVNFNYDRGYMVGHMKLKSNIVYVTYPHESFKNETAFAPIFTHLNSQIEYADRSSLEHIRDTRRELILFTTAIGVVLLMLNLGLMRLFPSDKHDEL